MIVERGTVLLLDLHPTVGREQRGIRPCIAVNDPDVLADQRFPLLAVIPLTSAAAEGALYPALQPGASGLARTSYALVDEVRSVDKRRVRRIFGRITADEMRAVDEGLILFLGLPRPTAL